MLFRRKRKLRRLENEQLLSQIDEHKRRLDSEKRLIEHSIDLSEDVLNRSKITGIYILVLIKRSRERHVDKNKLQ